MSAFTPPRADLRGGNQSAGSFIMSRRIFAQSASLCFFANNFQMIRGLTPREANPLTLALIRAIPRGSGSRQSSFSNHVHTSDRWYVREQWVVRKSLSAKATRPDKHPSFFLYFHHLGIFPRCRPPEWDSVQAWESSLAGRSTTKAPDLQIDQGRYAVMANADTCCERQGPWIRTTTRAVFALPQKGNRLRDVACRVLFSRCGSPAMLRYLGMRLTRANVRCLERSRGEGSQDLCFAQSPLGGAVLLVGA